MAESQRIKARVIKRGHARAEGGKLVRYRKGDFLLVTARELKAFSNVLAEVSPSEAAQAEQDAAASAGTQGASGSSAAGGGGAETVILRTDGPTLAEYVAAGYLAENYPPHGYASREPVVVIDETPAPGAEAAADAADLAIEARRQRVREAPDVQALRIIAEEFAVKVNKSWGVDRTREFLLLELSHSDGG
jgi:hypothetical protein